MGRAIESLRQENADLKKTIEKLIPNQTSIDTKKHFNRKEFFPCADKEHFEEMDCKVGPETDMRRILVCICSTSLHLFILFILTNKNVFFFLDLIRSKISAPLVDHLLIMPSG